MVPRIFRFSSEHCDWTGGNASKSVLGGKGAGLVQMCQAGMPVPPGFTITTDVCNEYRKLQEECVLDKEWVDTLMEDVAEKMEWLAVELGYEPLVSVRSGAPVSMPGMMDTILNVGLTNGNLGEWVKRLGYRAAIDSQRRLIQMLGSTAYGVPHEVFEFQLAKIKKAAGVTDDTALDGEQLDKVVLAYLAAFRENKGFDFPMNNVQEQLKAAVIAVFQSWMNPRAIEYRKINKIDESMGTAVNIQAMVFGNMGETSGTGVLFTRDPSTGENHLMGEFLVNAQGEDVVAGIRTPEDIAAMKTMFDHHAMQGGMLLPVWPEIYKKIETVCSDLEDMYRDMVDMEFTVQEGKLWLLQSRVGKRSARAAFRIAVDLVEEGVISRGEAFKRLTREQFKIVRRPTIDPSFKENPARVGLPACPGVVSGKPVFSSDDAVNCTEPCILITHETTPDDIKGMAAAVGILTKTGGATSHAAVVARAMDKACVVGCTDLDMKFAKQCKKVTIDGSTGNVWFETDVPVIDASDAPAVQRFIQWSLEGLGAAEDAVVDLGDCRPQVIRAAHWWGNEDVMNAVLDGIAELPVRKTVVLDCAAPSFFVPAEDTALASCFGAQAPELTFSSDLMKALHKRADEMTGLGLRNCQSPSLFGLGYRDVDSGPVGAPMAVPGDYAAFSMLS